MFPTFYSPPLSNLSLLSQAGMSRKTRTWRLFWPKMEILLFFCLPCSLTVLRSSFQVFLCNRKLEMTNILLGCLPLSPKTYKTLTCATNICIRLFGWPAAVFRYSCFCTVENIDDLRLHVCFIQVPSLCEDLLSSVDQPLKIARDKVVGKDYLLCDYNRDGDSYRLSL